MITRCRHCNKVLALNETAWTCGPMFCTFDCGVEWAKTKYESFEYVDELDLQGKATAFFTDIAEEISREDYGARVHRYSVYSSSHDITTVFEQVLEGDEVISQTVVGWYYGNETDNVEKYGLTAIYVE